MMLDQLPPVRVEDLGVRDTELSILGSLVPIKRVIWSAKSSLCVTNSSDTKLCETSVRELIGQDPGLEPFFDIALRNHYEKSWLPTEMDLRLGFELLQFIIEEAGGKLVVLGESSGEGGEGFRPESELWEYLLYIIHVFSSRHYGRRKYKGPSPLNQSKKQRVRKSVRLSNQGKVMRSRRIRVLPNQSQREIIRDCMGIHRHIYNE